MTNIKQKTLIQFGAGKIGRSFIAQLFARGGYRVFFVDIDKEIINELNRRHNYSVIIKSNDQSKVINIPNVSGIHFQDEEKIINTMIESDIGAISVGKNALPNLIPLLA